MTAAELAEKLEDIAGYRDIVLKHRKITDDKKITYVLKDGTRIHEDESVIAKLAASLTAALESAAETATEAAARLRSMEEALENIDAAAPFVPPHPSESEYDFGSQYFNTSDDYALHRANRDASRIGDIARAAISGEGQ